MHTALPRTNIKLRRTRRETLDPATSNPVAEAAYPLLIRELYHRCVSQARALQRTMDVDIVWLSSISKPLPASFPKTTLFPVRIFCEEFYGLGSIERLCAPRSWAEQQRIKFLSGDIYFPLLSIFTPAMGCCYCCCRILIFCVRNKQRKLFKVTSPGLCVCVSPVACI